jgi:hypothetical protein
VTHWTIHHNSKRQHLVTEGYERQVYKRTPIANALVSYKVFERIFAGNAQFLNTILAFEPFPSFHFLLAMLKVLLERDARG